MDILEREKTMRHRFMAAMSISLLVLVAGLFILSCSLSRKQYLANVQSIRADYLEILTRETSNLREKIKTLESKTFALFDQPDLPFDLYLTNGLFFVKEGQFFPAVIPDILHQNTVDPEAARKMLTLGLELQNSGRSEKAREYLEAASRIAVKTHGDLDVKLSACTELLKASEYRELRRLFSIFYSLANYPGIRPDDVQARKYEDMLRGSISKYDHLQEQSREILKTASEISAISSNRPAPFRILYNNSILSVNVKGQAFLLPVETLDQTSSNAILRVTATEPGADAVVSRQLRPLPVYAWIPAKEFETRKQSAERAYLLTNIMLGVLLIVIAGMGIGIGVLVKRQHEVNALRSSFVSAVSHELRTPMSLIRLYAESLTSERTPVSNRERYAKAIMAETDRLSALVNNVLDFSRLEKGSLTLNLQETNISAIVSEVLDSFTFRLEKENIKLIRNIAPNLTAYIDSQAMTQVIFNLVDNAIKYSGENHKIEVEMTAPESKTIFRIKDDGIGIQDSLKPRIFEPFVRGDDTRVTAQRGSGIGLSVVKQILDRMQCTINVFDNVPRGTVFEIVMERHHENSRS